ncbi:hypothetical protein RTG_00205 [Rhodotorula toruloides ATCC 204091]|uniref:Choline kinase n=1 Tax=Rhodotorula toruloides TaxID=5286 RepID=A0A0K3CHV6_RHOTO|nr:hypothetical protein RTG_00205 [Rhodotorula toruloides ATCC 204091]
MAPVSPSGEPILVQIPPSTSPLLLPARDPINGGSSRQRRSSTDSFSLEHNRHNPDIPDDLEFVAPGQWDEATGQFTEEDEDESEDDGAFDEDDDIEDWTLEDGHVEGVPCSNIRLDAKCYQSTDFLDSLLTLLRDELGVPGWADLPNGTPSSLVQIHKISGALTNAVFFVSIPETEAEIEVTVPVQSPEPYEPHENGFGTPIQRDAPRLFPATVFSELERGRNAASTPRPGQDASDTPPQASTPETPVTTHTALPGSMPDMPFSDSPTDSPSDSAPQSPLSRPTTRIEQTVLSAPTVLLRIYGPSSGSLISRKNELYILHTLSSQYGIGAHVLGTFGNGRVEEYFHSRALVKEEMRDSRVSRWIGRRMRELHSVDLEHMVLPLPEAEEEKERERRHRRRMKSRSTSAEPQRPASEKKRSRRYGTGSRGRRSRAHDKLCIWENITRWTREAKLVMKELDELAQIPGFDKLLSTASAASTPAGPSSDEHVPPLSCPSRTFAIRSTLNLPLFEQQIRLYRQFVHKIERTGGKSKRVFSHNDTQYGNLLLMTPTSGKKEDEEELERAAIREGGAHRRLIVVDFEYAGANPRGFDIANHFCEWRADYHHPSLSHSLSAHQPYPTRAERTRFLRAYVGADQGYDGPDDPQQPPNGSEDPRVERLLEEVRIWEPSSHAMWAVWGIVQAKEDLLARIQAWKDKAQRSATSPSPSPSPVSPGTEAELVASVKAMGLEGQDVAELVDMDDLADVGEVFDYLSYAAERMEMFRQELRQLGVVE